MRFFKYLKSILLVTLSAGILTTSAVYIDKVNANPVQSQVQENASQGNYTAPLSIVNNPKAYLNKSVVIKAKFDKFSTLGLDYKPAFRSSEEYITFLIQRDDVQHDIPLSEMKLFLKRELAEKMIDLKTNDEIKISGVIFSDALGDTWIDVSDLTVLNKAPRDKKTE